MSDGDSVDALIRALYETISGPPGPRDWDRFRALFVPEARLVRANQDLPRSPVRRRLDALVVRATRLVGDRAGAHDFADRARAHIAGERTSLEVLGVDAFVPVAKKSFAREGLWEREIDRRTEQSGSIAHVMSRYEARRTADGPVFSRGTNSVQLVRQGEAWRIVSLLWDDENA